ncbi:hypothetical protein PBY51_002742 [Eleginops maclovinus]|uniref:Ig-like domain-containing protein n=1 Tax=Eleginops maclovinus TaxID=56733 RepID=A0AAN7XD95_ELEMC|nr:hypothetical protein PBY51_002742 [Eleginops maclovinus]
MVGGCQSCFLTYMSVLLLGCSLHDVEDSGDQVIHKTVGDTVELAFPLRTEKITSASWSYKGSKIANINGLIQNTRFNGRLEFNKSKLSLTLRELAVNDSGEFSFNFAKDTQKTIRITLHVHESITEEPVVNFNSTWHASNASCTVLLDCSATPIDNVSYQWTVENQTFDGSRLQYIISLKDGSTNFNCTISNHVRGMSTIREVNCRNVTSEQQEGGPVVLPMIVAVGCCLLVTVTVGVAVCVYCHKKSQAVGVDSNELTVYADINDVAIRDVPSPQKPCSLYETITNVPVQPAPHTVYAKIELGRLRKESVSPYQEIS